MATVTCARCGRTAEGLPAAPYPDAVGELVLRNVCAGCWREYMGRQVMVINEYRLDLLDPRAQEVLTRDLLEYLKLEGLASGGEGVGGALEGGERSGGG